MKAGRELDALVAEKVMGWTDRHGEFAIPPNTSPHRGAIRYMPEKVLPYSADIGSAWQVVEKLRNTHKFQCFTIRPTIWEASFWLHTQNPLNGCTATSQSLEEAICKAALMAVGVEVECSNL